MSSQRETNAIHLAIVVTTNITAETFVQNYARYVASEGFRVTIIADGLENSMESVGNGSLTFISHSMERDPSLVKDLKSVIGLTKLLRSIKPDILVYATPKASLLTAIAGLLVGIPKRIYQLWGLRLETTTGIKRKILASLETVTCLCSTKVLANSESLRENYIKLGLNRSKKIDVIGEGSSHGVDLDRFSKDAIWDSPKSNFGASLTDFNDSIKVGFVGRLHPDKGIDTLIDAIDLVSNSGIKVVLILVGGDEGANLEITDNPNLKYEMVGHVSDARHYYALMDLLVLPSLREGFPNVVLEAAAMGVPAVVSDGTGVVDSVVDGVTGLIVPVGGVIELSQAISKLAKDAELRAQLGRSAHERAKNSFNQDDVWENTLSYYLD